MGRMCEQLYLQKLLWITICWKWWDPHVCACELGGVMWVKRTCLCECLSECEMSDSCCGSSQPNTWICPSALFVWYMLVHIAINCCEASGYQVHALCNSRECVHSAAAECIAHSNCVHSSQFVCIAQQFVCIAQQFLCSKFTYTIVFCNCAVCMCILVIMCQAAGTVQQLLWITKAGAIVHWCKFDIDLEKWK